MQKLSKKRSEYKPLFWLAKETFLEFLIFDQYTVVKSQLIFQKNVSHYINDYNLNNYPVIN